MVRPGQRVPTMPRSGWGTAEHNRNWLNIDCCGIVCAAVTWFIVLFCDYGIIFTVIKPWLGASFAGLVHGGIFLFCSFLGLASHLRAMLSNPGAVPPEARSVNPTVHKRTCQRCHVFKPPRAHHCSICGRCIIKMDHHCPWVNNCVGLANHKFFILFLLYIFTICAHALMLISYRFYVCLPSKSGCSVAAGSGLVVVIVVIMAVLFGLFTLCMMIDQIHTVVTNQTGIDRLKAKRDGGAGAASENKLWENLQEVFGGEASGPKWHWFFPTPIQYPNAEQLTGYCFREVPLPRSADEIEMV